jgi:hypothetical protein
MGARLVKFEFIPKENEEIEALIKVPEDKRSVIHGIVKDWRGNVVKDAVVNIFEVVGKAPDCSLKTITHTFTDECGQFLFGPLCANKKYAIKVWFNEAKTRQIVIAPEGEKCNTICNDFMEIESVAAKKSDSDED